MSQAENVRPWQTFQQLRRANYTTPELCDYLLGKRSESRASLEIFLFCSMLLRLLSDSSWPQALWEGRPDTLKKWLKNRILFLSPVKFLSPLFVFCCCPDKPSILSSLLRFHLSKEENPGLDDTHAPTQVEQ